jgi:hypothetical protein
MGKNEAEIHEGIGPLRIGAIGFYPKTCLGKDPWMLLV